MKDYILDNGLKLIYKKSNSELSSIAISLDAGATRDGKVLGVAHVTEHMVYKGTEIRSEQQINEELSREKDNLNKFEYVEKVAREELGMTKPGEVPYISEVKE